MGIRRFMMCGPLIFPASAILLTKSHLFPGGCGFGRFVRGGITLLVSFASLTGVSLYLVFSYLAIVEAIRAGFPVYVAQFLLSAFCMNFVFAVFCLDAVTRVFATRPKQEFDETVTNSPYRIRNRNDSSMNQAESMPPSSR
jgi:hypothetical protein